MPVTLDDYQKAVERETWLRDTAFLGLTEKLCGNDVLPLTARHVLWLDTLRSPFINERPFNDSDALVHLANFIRVITPVPPFKPDDKANRECFEQVFCLRYRGTEAVKLIREIHEYLDDAFMDMPATSGGGGRSYYSFAASVVHRLAKTYGWSIEYCLDLPLKIVFQLIKCQREDDYIACGKRPVLFNPSDSILSKYLDETMKLEAKPEETKPV